ncbi:MAG: IS630 family transposase [Candidatus Thiodiazotropha taylori]|nr:IS630 family transposase [Candidatus Thiodiazotropha taylori]MCW4285265.1 IS630 family transposase [Candidatus Thiodiazotropha taylori]
MPNRGGELGSDQKELIVQLSEDGLSGTKIANLLKLNRFTVLKFLKRFKLCGSIENKQRSGRPRKTDSRADRRLIRILKVNRRKTLQDLTSAFNDQTPTKISRTTVKRRLKFHGYKRRVVKKKTVISKKNRVRRRAWCHGKLHVTVNNYWRKVIFSDETQVVLGKDSKVYVWGKDNEKWLPRCLGEHSDPKPHVRASVMFWGCITYDGVGTLVPVDGNINSQKYVNILEDNLWPVVAKVFPNSPWIFQDDNATPHVSRYTMQWKQRNQIPTMMWPAQSPDINIIENVWRKMKILLQRRVHDIHSREDLIDTVMDIWSAFTPAYIKSLYVTLPTRIRHVLRANGCITKY